MNHPAEHIVNLDGCLYVAEVLEAEGKVVAEWVRISQHFGFAVGTEAVCHNDFRCGACAVVVKLYEAVVVVAVANAEVGVCVADWLY